jgi:hypothetical protein
MRILLNKQTGQLTAYPRNDDQPVVGLDRGAFAVLEQIHLAAPEPGPGQAVRPLPPVVEIEDPAGEDLNGTATYGWEVFDLQPAPNWAQFRSAIRVENGFSAAFMAAFQADPMVAHTLGSRLDRFQTTGDFALFLESLTLALGALPTQEGAHIAMELLALSHRCNLPVGFTQALEAMFEQGEPAA